MGNFAVRHQISGIGGTHSWGGNANGQLPWQRNRAYCIPDRQQHSAVPTINLARLGRLEAVLLLAREPLSTRKLAQMANLADATEARTLLGELQRRYDERGCAFRVVALAGGYQLRSRSKFARWLGGLVPSVETAPLSGPAMETLAVVAYRQPLPRAEVEAIRGVQCGELLRQLMDRDLLRIVGRSEELGRPFLYGTTRRFLQVFGLRNLNELPRAAQLRRHVAPQMKA